MGASTIEVWVGEPATHLKAGYGVEEIYRGGDDGRRSAALPKKVSLDTDQLQHALQQMTASIGKVLSDAANLSQDFPLEEVTVTVEVSAEGTVALLGTGATLGGQGGIELTFRRRSSV